ncbi:MAG TPA: FG-GAP-like repeat-containing protein [Candidatus Tectomicrobia bacterium]|nr:FG-GAP-like repeat-containing protein [Candidatus Tectomicrobia bacterium]
MLGPPWLSWRHVAVLALLILFGVGLYLRRGDDGLGDPASKRYHETVAAFHTSLAAMQVGVEVIAEEKLLRVTELAPQEPAAWANLGLLALRRTAFDLAAERLQKARALAPDSSQIQVLSGLLESMQGRLPEARAYLQRAVAIDPHNAKAVYTLAQLTEQQGGEHSGAEVQRLLTQLLEAQPGNLAVWLELARVAAKRGDSGTMQDILVRLEGQAAAWPAVALEQLRSLQTVASEGNPNRTAQHVMILQNVLMREATYRQSHAAIRTPIGQEGEVIPRFLRLPAPQAHPAPPDPALTFAVEQLSASGGPWMWISASVLEAEGSPAVMMANGHAVRVKEDLTLRFPGGPGGQPPLLDGIVWIDFNADFKMDLAFAGAGGLALFRQDEAGAFTDATAQMALSDAVTAASYAGVWTADVDLEGDLDIVLAPLEGPPLVLRNNGDDTFMVLRLFDQVAGLRAFAWGDLDADGAPDAVLLDMTGTVHVYANHRGGQFEARALPHELGKVLAVAVADVDSDSVLDLVVLQVDGRILRLSHVAEGSAWRLMELTRWPEFPSGIAVGTPRLLIADVDNNGSLDFIVSTPGAGRVWLSDAQNEFRPLDKPLPGMMFSASDLTGDGKLDMLGLSEAGQPIRLVNRGTKNYSWLTLQPRAVPVPGEGRINSFGVGGEVEVRAGLLFQKQPITGPMLHFGLGEHRTADVARIIWPNGDVQAEFELQAKQVAVARQRLKGSCPWLFAYDGEALRFVTDFIWRSPLGLRINAQDMANVMMTEDWVKVRGDQLVARDGVYDLRITAELWETHFFDHISLLVVDHPVGTEIYVDERFAIPPPHLAVFPTAPPRPVDRAWDDQGQEVTDLVRARDGRYLDTFGRGTYQGVTREHYVEIDLGTDVPPRGPLWLLASGWIRPTDSSINVAISQGRHTPPQGLRLEVPDGRGGWVVARSDLGFPAGKTKTILIDLQGIWRPGAPRLLRLRTNLEVYWDAFAWAPGLPETELKTQRLSPQTAELRYRGFSVVQAADRSSPELPQYHLLEGTAPRWRDLIGYYTRFGDVRELLEAVDDRYVIMNAGDELVLHFVAPQPPLAGWRRDFVLIGDGWVKDGDYNTAFSKTVLPLPAHDQPDYSMPPGDLEDDPVYGRHAQDWQRYHTRYITPKSFHEALRRP